MKEVTVSFTCPILQCDIQQTKNEIRRIKELMVMKQKGDFISFDKRLPIMVLKTKVIQRLRNLNYTFTPSELNKIIQTIKHTGSFKLDKRKIK